MANKPRAKFDPGQQRYIILCGCGNYCKDTEILCGRCRYYHDNRIGRRPENDVPIGLNLQFVDLRTITSPEEASRIADNFHRKAVNAEIARTQEKRDRHVEHALKDKRGIHDSIMYDFQSRGRVYRSNTPYGQRLGSVTVDLMKAEEEIARLQGVEKSLRAQLEEAGSVRLTASFQVGHEVKFASMTSLGWVNVYKNSNGRLQTGGCPHSSQWSASSNRSSNPIGKYLGTFQIFAKDFES